MNPKALKTCKLQTRKLPPEKLGRIFRKGSITRTVGGVSVVYCIYLQLKDSNPQHIYIGCWSRDMVLTYYYHLLSQPCRALYIFMKLNDIPFVEKPIALLKGEHRGEDFKKINQFKKVPVIDDDGFILTESVAILKYLTIKYKVADHWYPKDDPLVQARIDEYMNWQHANTRTNAALFFQNLLLIPMMTQRPINVKKVEQYKRGTNDAIDGIETYFLRDNKYLCGNEITLADLLGVCELMQLCAVSEEKIWTSHTTVKAWMERVRERLNPYFDEAHQIVFEFREKYKTLKPQFSKM